jgi:release factor glutamine methyltransferase
MPAPDLRAGDGGATRLGDAVAEATRRLAEAGVETPGVDARRIVAATCGVTTGELIARPEQSVAPDVLIQIEARIARRCAREPVSRILGTRDFYGLTFALSPATLDPRPDSETLIELTLDLVAEKGWRDQPLRILDVGTGTGCLLITLLAELPRATGLGTDISAEALAVARANARLNGVAERARFAEYDLLSGVTGPFDILVCNPPYIPSATIETLEPEVRDFDPRGALDGGADGLAPYRSIAPRIKEILPAGWAVFEVGVGQAESVAKLLHQMIPDCGHGEKESRIRYRNDLGGQTRCVAVEIQL